MSKQIFFAAWVALTLFTSRAWADCSIPVASYTANLQPLARDLRDYQDCFYRSAARVSCADEFSRVHADQLRFEAYGLAVRQCLVTPASPFEGIKFYIDGLDTEVRAVETRIREMLPWDPGESRLWLRSSAAIAFMVLGSVSASIIAVLAERLAKYIFSHRPHDG